MSADYLADRDYLPNEPTPEDWDAYDDVIGIRPGTQGEALMEAEEMFNEDCERAAEIDRRNHG